MFQRYNRHIVRAYEALYLGFVQVRIRYTRMTMYQSFLFCMKYGRARRVSHTT